MASNPIVEITEADQFAIKFCGIHCASARLELPAHLELVSLTQQVVPSLVVRSIQDQHQA